ncbi:MAG: DUF427 domain-containing protein [Maricaulaceae bacterium]
MKPPPSKTILMTECAHWRNTPRERPPKDRIVTPGPGQESVWDFPRPPRVEPVSEPVRVVFADCEIARSAQALRVVETAGAPCYYLPPEDVDPDVLRPTDRWTVCEWKGLARYWDVVVGKRTAAEAAWAYPDPFDDLPEDYPRLAGFYAFYPARMDACFIGAEQIVPQPGGYYGGWVSTNLTGPIKGAPGSARW